MHVFYAFEFSDLVGFLLPLDLGLVTLSFYPFFEENVCKRVGAVCLFKRFVFQHAFDGSCDM